MTADEIREERKKLAAAEPFADLAEAARGMIIHLESLEASADMVRDGLLKHYPGDLQRGLENVRGHVLDDYAKLRDELHAAVDRVMRSPLIDGLETETKPAPESEEKSQ